MYSERIIHVTGFDVVLQLKDAALYDNSKKLDLYFTPSTGSETTATLTSNSSASSNVFIGGQPVNLGLPLAFDMEDDAVTLSIKAKESNILNLPADLRTTIDGHSRLNNDAIENLYIVMKYYVE